MQHLVVQMSSSRSQLVNEPAHHAPRRRERRFDDGHQPHRKRERTESMRKTLITAMALAVAGASGTASAAVLKIVGPITTAVSLSAANEYILDNAVFIKNGGSLTIPAGVVV